MITLILLSHIAIASVLTIATAKVSVAAYKQESTSTYHLMLGSFVVTILSGIGLLFVGAGGIGRICATMSAVSLVVFVVRYYYRMRVVAQTV
ncbi:MAG: hypothetical protein ABIR46_01430 [Candidatus Saccharimonadales bacterium]